MKAILKPLIPEFSVAMGGASSIDVTRPGVDKAYGILKLKQVLGIPIGDMIFVGDALFPGGNDEPARKTGATCIKVRDPEETGRVIEAVIACTDGVTRRPLSPPACQRSCGPTRPGPFCAPLSSRPVNQQPSPHAKDDRPDSDAQGCGAVGRTERPDNTPGGTASRCRSTARNRYEEVSHPITDRATASPDQCKLIGAYFSEEFAFESAALFNPSIVAHPDQSGVEAGGLRSSFRSAGSARVTSRLWHFGPEPGAQTAP